MCGKFHLWGEACLLKMYMDSTKRQVKKCPSFFVLPRNVDSFLISSQFGTLFSSDLLSGHKKFSSVLSAYAQIIHKVCNELIELSLENVYRSAVVFQIHACGSHTSLEREVGGGIGLGKTCNLKAVSFQCMTKFTTN